MPISLSREEARTRLPRLQTHCPLAMYAAHETTDGKYVIFSHAVYLLLLAWFEEYLTPVVHNFKMYFDGKFPPIEKIEEDGFIKRVLLDSFIALQPYRRFVLCIKTKRWRNESHYVGDHFLEDMFTIFKEYLWFHIGCPEIDMSSLKDIEFSKTMEQEWKYLLQFSDYFFDFTVHPRFLDSDMMRYAKLQRKIGNPILWSMIDYAALKLVFSPRLSLDHIDQKRREYFRNLLAGLVSPLVSTIIDKLFDDYTLKFEKGAAPTRRELQDIEAYRKRLESEIKDKVLRGISEDYVFWYHCMKKYKIGEPFSLKEQPLPQNFKTSEEYEEAWNEWIKKEMEKSRVNKGESPPFRYYEIPTGYMVSLLITPEVVAREFKDEKELKMAMKMTRWTRPSYYIWARLNREILGRPLKKARRFYYRQFDEAFPEESYPGYAREWRVHRINPPRRSAQERFPMDIIIDGKRYFSISHLAHRIRCSEQTIRNRRDLGLRCEWRPGPGSKRTTRWYEADMKKIEELSIALQKYTKLADRHCVSVRHIKYLVKKYRLSHLKPYARKRRLEKLLRKEAKEKAPLGMTDSPPA